MTDALSLLRSSIIRGDTIDSDAQSIIIAGKTQLDRKLQTNFHSMRGRGPSYTLEAVYFQFKHHKLPYNDYLAECNKEQVPHVTLVDKKELIAYLKGDILESTCLVATAPSTGAVPVEAHDYTASPDDMTATSVDTGGKGTKRPLAANEGLTHTNDAGELINGKGDRGHPLALQARDQRALDSVMYVESWDFTALREKLSKHIEQTRNELNSGAASHGGASSRSQAQSLGSREGQAYDPRGDRYTAPDDRFWRENMGSDFYEMGIDPSGTFKASGSTASTKSSGTAKKERTADIEPPRRNDRQTKQQVAPPKRNEVSLYDQIPIIIVPISTLSMLTFHNAQVFLENGSFIPMQELRTRGALATAAQSRQIIVRKPGGTTNSARYELVCNPIKLTSSEWKRAVGVVCTGQAWQFKNWPWWENDKTKKQDNGVSEIFHDICGIVFHYDDTAPPQETKNWAVKFLALSRTKRHNDVKVQNQFWQLIDSHCRLHKRTLIY